MADAVTNFLAGRNAGREYALSQQAEQRQFKLNSLAGQAYAADPSQRDAIIGQAVGVDAQSGLALGKSLEGGDDRRQTALVNMSRLYLNTPPEYRGQLVSRMAPDLQRYGLNVTEDGPELEQAATAFVESYGGSSGASSGKVVGNALVDPISGRVIYQGPEVPVNAQIVGVPDGKGGEQKFMFDPKTRQLMDLPSPDGQPPQQQATPAPQRPGALQPDSVEMAILKIEEQDGPLPPEIRQKLAAQMQGGGNFTVANRPGGAPSIGPDTVSAPSQQPPPSGGGRLGYTPPPSAKVGAAPAGYRYTPDGGALVKIPGGPADKQSESKPLPVGALRLQLDAQESLSVAEGVDSLLAGFESQLEQGLLDLGPAKNLSYQARNMAGASNPQSQAYASFTAGLEKLRNDSLRLNKGVQTDGDAQRAWNELMANINDPGVVKQRLQEIRQINRRGEALQREKMRMIDRNYAGKEAAAPEDDISDLLQLYGDDI